MVGDLLTFIEMNGFLDEWFQMGLTDEDLELFQAAIMANTKIQRSRELKGFASLKCLVSDRTTR